MPLPAVGATIASVGKTVASMNASLTKREASRLAQNVRRKLQRRLANELTKEIGEKVTWKEAESVYRGPKIESSIAADIYSDIGKLKSVTKEGTKQKVGYAYEISEIQEKTEKFRPSATVQARRNLQFQSELNLASKRGVEGEEQSARLKKGETHAFYAATQFAWSGVSVEANRNKAIMETFGINDLEQVYKLIVDKDLNYKDFGFSSEKDFNDWLDELSKKHVDIKKVREVYQTELAESSDEPESKYPKNAIRNIVMNVARLKLRAG